MSILERLPMERRERFSINRIPTDQDRVRIFPETQAGIYTLPFTRQQLLSPRPTPTDPNNLMDRLNALYTRTITPYIMPKEEDTGGGTGIFTAGALQISDVEDYHRMRCHRLYPRLMIGLGY